MSDLLVLGAGPLPSRPTGPASASGQRVWQFARALAEDGHRVRVLLTRGADPETATVRTPAGATIEVEGLAAEELDAAAPLRRRILAGPCDALVGASSYASFLLARSRHPAPLWVDFHGDPMAEGQALARHLSEDGPVERFWWMLAWCLRRGDRFSAVSAPQRFAVLGQLGACGRLNRATAGLDLVSAIPDACEVPPASAFPAAGRFEILFTGSFNTWIDGDGFAAAIQLALREEPGIQFRICGGEVRGFVETAWQRFVAGLRSLPAELAQGVDLRGWVAEEELERIEECAGCGVVPELALAERELGSQNRSLRWMARARPLVTTAQSELGRAVKDGRLGLTYPPGDSRALADSLLTLARDRSLAAELGRNARAWVLTARSVESTAAPLVAWARDPRPAPDLRDGTYAPLARRHPELLRDQLHLERESAPGSET